MIDQVLETQPLCKRERHDIAQVVSLKVFEGNSDPCEIVSLNVVTSSWESLLPRTWTD